MFWLMCILRKHLKEVANSADLISGSDKCPLPKDLTYKHAII